MSFWLVIDDEGRPGRCPVSLPLREGKVVLGRGPKADVALADPDVSRAHLEVERRGERVTFRDLGSRGGTRLDGTPRAAGELQPGAVLCLGHTLVRLALEPACRTLEPDAAPASEPPGPDGAGFRRFVDLLRAAGDPRLLLERLLGGLVDLFGAERGFVLLREPGARAMVVVASHRVAEGDEVLAVSRTVCERALAGGSLLVIPNSLLDDRCVGSQSLRQLGCPRTVVAAPLAHGGEALGALYLDMPATDLAPGDERLALFETVTGLAAQLVGAAEVRAGLLEARERVRALNVLTAEGAGLVLGDGPASRALRELIEAAAPQDVSVLVLGETGTGKEMVARALHRRSPRREGPFIAISCAALPRDLLEAELFGVERGAFTGAAERRLGRFELAQGGTLFLDEVGELPVDVQVKLLRVLQERSLVRLGGTAPVPLDFRLVAATNADLEDAVRQGTLRRDFLFRLDVLRIQLEPLRARPEDVLPLARHFLDLFAPACGRRLAGFTPEAEELLRRHPWPGNVRELRNAVERAVVVERGPRVAAASLPLRPPPEPTAAAAGALGELPEDFETARRLFLKTFLERSLLRHGGNVTAVANATGMPRRTIYARLRELGLEAKD